MASLCDFIHICDKNLDVDTCNQLIELFNTNSMDSSYNLTDNREVSSEITTIHNNLVKKVIEARDEYYQFCFKEVFPETHAFEKFVITKITPDIEDSVVWVDIHSYEDARRFLKFTWYLNDNKAGQTTFLDLTIQPEQGKLIIYPPVWLFPHKELPPIEEPKYILTTYLHYK
jgi:hypothetical protein